jgi:hypothetical protein
MQINAVHRRQGINIEKLNRVAEMGNKTTYDIHCLDRLCYTVFKLESVAVKNMHRSA